MEAESVAARVPYRGGFPVFLARYVIFGEEKRRAALHFFNASEIGVTGVRYILTEKDADGNVLAEHALQYEGVYAERGTEFAVADVAVSRKCASVEARVTAALSDGYEYAVEGNEVRVKYGISEREKEYVFLRRAGYKRSGKMKRMILFAFAAVLGLTAAAGAIAWRVGLFDDIKESDGTNTAIERTVSEHVEA